MVRNLSGRRWEIGDCKWDEGDLVSCEAEGSDIKEEMEG